MIKQVFKILLFSAIAPIIILKLASVPVLEPAFNSLYKAIFGDYTQVIRSMEVYTRDKNNFKRPTNELIEIHQVDLGLKLVEAKSMHGAMFGMGFVHGKDRLWMLKFYRALAYGRLSETFGDETVSIDKYIRTMGLEARAKEHMKVMLA